MIKSVGFFNFRLDIYVHMYYNIHNLRQEVI
nr:MAG TPA: hypothetical protein [Caudoviricetes sp.]DAR49654.1 MAG TPA: hypothetical protein [Caudoviricetes sp.]